MTPLRRHLLGLLAAVGLGHRAGSAGAAAPVPLILTDA